MSKQEILNKVLTKFKAKNKEALKESVDIIVEEYLATVVAESKTPIDDLVYATTKETVKKILNDLIENM